MGACIVCVKAAEQGVTVDESRSGREWARVLGVGETAVRRHRKHVLGGVATIDGDASVPAGESESHNPDGSASYVRYSAEPWGFEDYREFIRATGQDPDLVSFTWGWTSNPGGGFWNKLNNVRPIAGTVESIDLPALYAEVRRTKHRPLKVTPGDSTAVVVWADMQLGKVGSRGGTPALLERLAEKRAALEVWLRASAPKRCVFVDAGDAVEGFENTSQQMFTNDLSHPQQVDVAAVEMWKTLTLMARFAPVDAVAVPSNHGAWRNGKQVLGKPSDDWGLSIQSRLRFEAELVGLPVTFHRPGDWDESVAIDVQGTVLGVHHGHQSPVDLMPKWWAGQVHGGQALASADVFVSGHYHHLRVQPTGRSPRTGKSKWWIQAPTLDNGSDWWRNKSGDDSDPGLLVFRIDGDGFSLQSLTIL